MSDHGDPERSGVLLTVLVLILYAVTGLFVYKTYFIPGYTEIQNARLTVSELQQEIEKYKIENKNLMLSIKALKENDPLCMEALRLFSEIYGAEAGNLALKSMSLGGLYIGGGIAPKILPVLLEDHFMKGFLSKGRFNALLEQMEILLSLDPDTALIGAAHYAKDRLLSI